MADSFVNLFRQPDSAAVELEKGWFPLEYTGGSWSRPGDVSVTVSPDGERDEMPVVLAPSATPIRRIKFRWRSDNSGVKRLLRDSWCVSVSDLGWMPLIAEQPLPWYFHTFDGVLTHGYGVRTMCNSFCFWQMDSDGINLWLDVRNGGDGVIAREPLTAAVIVTRRGVEGESAYAAAKAFCKRMCPAPVLPGRPVYGLNNWYYAYGKISADSVRADAALSWELAGDTPYPPFMVIDDGWQPTKTRGPFDRGNMFMGEMDRVAQDIAGQGCVPGIWIRPLMTAERVPEDWLHPYRRESDYYGGAILDPSRPEVLDYVARTARRVEDWGFRLIKYDFTCPDFMGAESFHGWRLTDEGWHMSDRSRTNAQIIMELYRAIRDAAPGCLMQGCNTYNHLTAGINHLQRSGWDTSGRSWERTRTAGVNTLAFRLPQNGSFFLVDPDCPAFTPDTPVEMNLRFLELAAMSGGVLIASVTPGLLDREQKERVKAAFRTAAAGKSMEPLDWMDTLCPARYRYEGDGQIYRFDWYTPTDGAALE